MRGPSRQGTWESVRITGYRPILAALLGLVQVAVLEVSDADRRRIRERVLALGQVVDMAVKPVHTQQSTPVQHELLQVRAPAHRPYDSERYAGFRTYRRGRWSHDGDAGEDANPRRVLPHAPGRRPAAGGHLHVRARFRALAAPHAGAGLAGHQQGRGINLHSPGGGAGPDLSQALRPRRLGG